jgi:hypothetical protein
MHLKSIGNGGSGHRRALQRISAHLESISPARIDPPSSAGGLLAGGGPQCRCPDRPSPAPLLRFASPSAHSGRAALPGVATHPGDPASALSSSLAGVSGRVGAGPRRLLLRSFASMLAPDRRSIAAPASIARRRASSPRSSGSEAMVAREASHVAWPRLAVPAALMGFDPSQS